MGVIALTGEPDRLLLASTAVALLLLAQKMCNEQYRLQHIAAGVSVAGQYSFAATVEALERAAEEILPVTAAF